MGPHQDAAAGPDRTPFRPTPFEFADLMYQWDAHDPDATPDVPLCDAFKFVPFTTTNDGNVRIDFDEDWGPHLRRLTGYIASIGLGVVWPPLVTLPAPVWGGGWRGPPFLLSCPYLYFRLVSPPCSSWGGWYPTFRDDTTAENTGTPYRIEVIAKIPFRANAHSDIDRLCPDSKSFVWARVRAFTSNALVERGTVIRLGTFVSGIGVASYNGSNRAHLDVWTPTDTVEWRFTAWDTLIESHEVDHLGYPVDGVVEPEYLVTRIRSFSLVEGWRY